MGEGDGRREKSIIAILVTFLLALILVYIIFVRVRGVQNIDNSPSTVSGSQFSSQEFGTLEEGDDDYVDTIDFSGSQTGGRGISIFEKSIESLNSSGLKIWYSDIAVAEDLSLSFEFAFTDEAGILYAYLGSGSLENLRNIVRELGGENLAIETRNDILRNHLWGDRVLFINIPDTTFVQETGQRLLVVMIVEMGEDKRFIQAPIEKYYAHKDDMKSYFETIYNTTW